MRALGIDHRSPPTAVREAPAFEGERLRRGLDALKADAPGAEFVLLSTCNRVERCSAATAEGTAVPKSPDDLRRRGPLDRQPSNRPGSW
jgi:glutamyl-tRNA reductase